MTDVVLKNLRYDIGAFKSVKTLLDEFKCLKDVSAFEFIEEKLEDEGSPVDEDVARMFLNAYKVRNFLSSAKEYYLEQQDEKYQTHYAKIRLESFEVLMYVIIFELNETNFQNLLPFLDSLIPLSSKVLDFFKTDDHTCKIVQIACQHYENEYIIENIINPLMRNKNLLDCLHKNLKDSKKKKVEQKPCTVPKPPSFSFSVKCPRAPPPTPENLRHFKANPAPKTTKRRCVKIKRELEKARSENYRRALDLIEIARADAFKCAIIPEKVVPQQEMLEPTKAKPCPKFAKVQIKPTQASLRREAAVLAKEREDEIQKIEDLINGACDTTNYQLLEDQVREARNQERLQELERKHLKGLLTYEEAILAKKKLLRVNQLKYEEFRLERAKLQHEIDDLKQAEMERNKVLVEKAQAIEAAAREAEKKNLEEKRCNAKLVDYETKSLLQEALKAREEEFEKKQQLIQEIRAIQQFNAATYIKDFDRTETANLGFLNEMSIAELQERLGLLKLKMQEELDERKEKIQQEKLRQQQDLDTMKVFIEEVRKCRMKDVANGSEYTEVATSRSSNGCKVSEVKESEDISQLRERLQRARNLRMGLDV